MKPTISVESLSENEFRVTVSEGSTRSSHRVTVQPRDYERIAGGKITAAELVRMSFAFLLEHESKESILPQFDLMAISRYFPSYEREIQRRLGSRP
jgi:hypothetical protein